jgi:hypothetical protein
MDKTKKLILVSVFIVFLISFGLAFMKYIVFSSYDVELSVRCDESQYDCFVNECEEDGCMQYTRFMRTNNNLLAAACGSQYVEDCSETLNCESVSGECSYRYCSENDEDLGYVCES